MKTLNLIQKFTLGGIAFGLIFPAIAFSFDLGIKNLPFTLENIQKLHAVNPIHFIIDTAPIIISIVAYLVGRRVYKHDEIAKLTIKTQLIEIHKKNEELQLTNAEKDKFFSIIAHDLRNPFIGLMSLTKMMSEKFSGLTVEEMQEFTLSIDKSATSLFRFLENLLNWAKMNQDLVPFNPEPVQLLASAKECAEIVMESSINKEIEITCDIQEDIKVFADNNMLLLIIRNLVSNAVKFTPKGGKIHLSVKENGDKHVVISVKDTGIGMNPEMLQKLFQLNAKINRKGTDGEPSTGLGLLLCKEFVEKQGGKIWAESEEGKGSEFKFTLPMAS